MMDRIIDCVRIDLKEGKTILLDPMKLQHVSVETLNRLDEAFTQVLKEISDAEESAATQPGVGDLGISVAESVNAKERIGG